MSGTKSSVVNLKKTLIKSDNGEEPTEAGHPCHDNVSDTENDRTISVRIFRVKKLFILNHQIISCILG